MRRQQSTIPLQLSEERVWDLLTKFQQFMNWEDARLVELDELQAIAKAHSKDLQELSPSSLVAIGKAHHLLDSFALLLAAIALGSVALGCLDHGQFYSRISAEVVKHFEGRATLDLCLAYFLQHVFALRSGTSDDVQSILTSAIGTAHELCLHHKAHGIRGLQLYLLIYMADQYCSLTHCTEPTICQASLPAQTFAPLKDAKPQLQTLIDLVTTNGAVIEQSHRRANLSAADITALEAKISKLYSRDTTGMPVREVAPSFRSAYEPLARIHMLCCRMNIRIRGLAEQDLWLPSMCICLHAAQNVLATYLELYQPALLALTRQTNNEATQMTHQLAVTWRQVTRIMTSAFVIVFAHCHGELVHGEAARYVAMARLLLEYPRWRWADNIEQAVQTLTDIADMQEFPLEEEMERLLPGSANNLTHSSERQHQKEALPPALNSVIDSATTGNEDTSAPLLSDFSTGSQIFDPTITFEEQSLFGLLDTFDVAFNGYDLGQQD
ncbi:hypothetical protein HII31_07632 [Pseudocercospora fuligena]|uniref:Transcription factor domain-containing protein n=1 Tax=Pseudocercospora fuligena TaxID=685502 RepID=A0A8H6VG24_9PEZI|nr:hypothetical protein HII31_07632 [Pseudocercospora fuligena]